MMAAAQFSPLPDRAVLLVGGEDARGFLQGLVSNDVRRVAPDRAIYAALLTPQGKYLFDFFIAEHAGTLLLDVERARKDELARRLVLYRLRSKVTIEDATGALAVAAVLGEAGSAALGTGATPGSARAFDGGLAFTDPRLAALGARVVLPLADGFGALAALGLARVDGAEYDRLRLVLGVPDGSRDLVVDKSFLLENNFEELNGVDFDKGCYVGQELTARTKFRGVVRKRLFRVDVDGPLPEPGTPVRLGDKEIGWVRSGRDDKALAFLRLEGVEEAAGAPLMAGAALLKPVKPDWARF
ncbi:MAG: folate-binding protein [Alphaproteobacteria bacterium]